MVVSSDRTIETPFRPFSQSVISRNILSSQVQEIGVYCSLNKKFTLGHTSVAASNQQLDDKIKFSMSEFCQRGVDLLTVTQKKKKTRASTYN